MRKLFGGMLLLCMLLFAEKLTGSGVHVLLGMTLIMVSVIHILKNKTKWPFRRKEIRVVDTMLVTVLILMFLSGMAVHMNETLFWAKILHKMSGLIFTAGVIGHTLQHRKQKRKAGERRVS